MNAKAITLHAGAVFLVSALTMFVAGAVGALILQVAGMSIHSSNDLVRVGADGGLLTLIIAFPGPFAFAAIDTAHTYRGGGA